MEMIMRRLAALAIALLVAPPAAIAQGWLPADGEGSVAVQWQYTFGRDHFFPLVRVDIGHIQTQACGGSNACTSRVSRTNGSGYSGHADDGQIAAAVGRCASRKALQGMFTAGALPTTGGACWLACSAYRLV